VRLAYYFFSKNFIWRVGVWGMDRIKEKGCLGNDGWGIVV